MTPPPQAPQATTNCRRLAIHRFTANRKAQAVPAVELPPHGRQAGQSLADGPPLPQTGRLRAAR